MQLYPYQQRWIDDESRFLCAVKSARIGFSYATGLRGIFKALARPNYTRTILSASKAQSVEFVETCKKNIDLMGAVAELGQEPFADALGATDIMVEKITFTNGSRILALPANPRTARGYPGDVTLDEFAHHQDPYAIWAAAIRQTALGNGLEALSTPNGETGKFFDIASDLGLADGIPPSINPAMKGPWSGHWIDVHMAVAEGCPINIPEMRAGVGDEDTWQQEFECQFLKAQGAWLTMQLVADSEHADATTDLPSGFRPMGLLYGGLDVGREGDQSCFWLDEIIGDVAWTRCVVWLGAMSFVQQVKLLSPLIDMCTRTAMDSTGLGIGVYDMLEDKFPGRVMGVNFGGSTKRPDTPASSGSDAGKSIKLKTKMAIDLKRQLEVNRARIPHDPQIRAELMAIKRETTASGVKFDAPRIETDTAVAGGGKKKVYSHAEAFWAKALSVFAAQSSPATLGMETSGILTSFTGSRSYL